MNLPNKLTVGRMIITCVFVGVVSIPFPYHRLTAFLLFIAASITDWVDGWLARKYGIITDFGQLFDPIADKILVCSAFIILLKIDFLCIPAWMIVIIISREFLITGLRLFALTKHTLIPATAWGKQKTISQMVSIITILFLMANREIFLMNTDLWKPVFDTYVSSCALALISFTTVMTIISGIVYTWRQKELFNDH